MYITPEGAVTPCNSGEHHPDTWFAKENSKRTAIAKQLCSTCDLRLACLSSTLRFERRAGASQPAVFGGLTESERNTLQRHPASATAAA